MLAHGSFAGHGGMRGALEDGAVEKHPLERAETAERALQFLVLGWRERGTFPCWC